MQPALHKTSRQKDCLFILGLFALIFLYFYKVLGLQYGFYSGDHRQQHYPWAFFYAQQLKQGMLPWWTSFLGCGFPLLAEGQVGSLYPLNFLFYKFFPFNFAYTYNILFHYCLGALFFYIWIRQQGMMAWAAFGGALLYLFGTAQGGYYYNIISLKTLIWFPLTLFWLHQIFIQNRYSSLFPLALTFAMELTAGYLQYAIYAILFCGISALFYFLREMIKGKLAHALKSFFAAFIAVFLGILMALPQLSATWELSHFSNRLHFPIEFAFLGSMSPLSAATLFFPHWDGFLGAELYFGSIGLFFLILSFCIRPFGSQFLHFSVGVFFAIFLALGKWNPIFKWMIEITHFSGFRVSTKFLYFAAVYGSALCAYAMHHWLENKNPAAQKKASIIWLSLQSTALIGIIACGVIFKLFDRHIYNWGHEYILKYYQESVIHPHSIDVYMTKLQQMIDFVSASLSLKDSNNLIFIAFIMISSIGFFLLEKYIKSRQRLFMCLLVILFSNLWYYGDTSIRGNIVQRSFLNLDSKIMDFLTGKEGRVHRIVSDLPSSVEMEIIPSNNMVRNITLLGIYSPFVTMQYYDWMEGVGDVNDSNKQKLFDSNQAEAVQDKLRLMGAKWIISDTHMDTWPKLQFVRKEKKELIYENKNALPRIFFLQSLKSDNLKEILDHAKSVDLIRSEDQQNKISFSIKNLAAGYLVISDLHYPGWHASVNGVNTTISPFLNLFKVIKVSKADKVDFVFEYRSIGRKFIPLSGALISFCFITTLIFLFRRNFYAAA